MKKFEKKIVFTTRNEYKFEKELVENLGAINLPYSLGASIKDALFLTESYNTETHSDFSYTENVAIDVYISNKEYNKEYNNILSTNKNINNNCNILGKRDELCTEIKRKAKGMTDIHLGCRSTKVHPTTKKGWSFILMTYAQSCVLNFHYVQDLIDTPYIYELEECDVKKTLATVMKTMSGESDNDTINYAMAKLKKIWGSFEELVTWMKNHRKETGAISNEFYRITNKDCFSRWMSKFLIDNDDYVDYSDDEIDHTAFDLKIYEYGAKRNQKWKSVVDRSGHFCLFVPSIVRDALATYKNKYGWKKTRKFLETSCGLGKYFDFDKVSRPMQTALAKYTKIMINDEEKIIYDYVGNIVIPIFDSINKETTIVDETQVIEEKDDFFDTIVEETIAQESQYKDLDILKNLEGLEESSQEWWDELNKPVDYKESPAISIRKQKDSFWETFNKEL